MKKLTQTNKRIEDRYKKRIGGRGFVVWLRAIPARIRRRDPRVITACLAASLVLLVLPLVLGLTHIPNGTDEDVMAIDVGTGVSDVSGSNASNAQTNSKTSNVIDITPPPTPIAPPSPTPVPMLLQREDKDPLIITVQERLMELGYMDSDEPTEYFGRLTQDAISIFQRTCNLTIDGVITQEVYDMLMGDTAPKYMVTVGIEGTDVKELQKRLRELGYIKDATGYFGTDTEEAVKEFQKRNKLDVDGKVGEQTREMLYSEDAVARAISYGEKSDEVKSYQQRLFKLGYLTTEPDGTFGRDTVAAVKLFQQLNGVIADGYIGPSTKSLLMDSSAQANAMTIGLSGTTVERVQSRLKSLSYIKKITGYYGSDTENAVRAFQKINGLSVDGKVGKQTMTALISDKAKKNTGEAISGSGGSKPSGGGGGGGGGSASNGNGVSAFISAAESALGSRYVRAGKGPNEFDCSGLVYYCLNQAGVKQSYLTSKMWRTVGKYQKIGSLNDLERGDVIVFYGHVAIAMGDGTMIDASSANGKVVHRASNTSWCRSKFICAYRIF
ncbi:MAG: peptidoglycan-binding protein [Clostridia bacterium]